MGEVDPGCPSVSSGIRSTSVGTPDITNTFYIGPKIYAKTSPLRFLITFRRESMFGLAVYLLPMIFSSSRLAIGYTIPQLNSVRPMSLNQEESTGVHCGFEGNGDLYGLGIRLGVYLQWFSALIIYSYYPKGRDELAFAYTSFVVAISIATLVLTADAHSTYVVEIFVLMFIIFGGVFTTVLTVAIPKRPPRRRGSEKPFAIRAFYFGVYTLLLTVTAIYCSWFWFRGIHHDFKKTPCGTYGFVMAKARLYRPAVYKFLAAMSLITCIFFGTSFIGLVCLVMDRLIAHALLEKRRSSSRNPGYTQQQHQITQVNLSGRMRLSKLVSRIRANGGQHTTPSSSNKLISILFQFVAPVVNVAVLLLSVIGIELTLYWNNVFGIYNIRSTGQLIPFVIGLAGLLKIVVGAMTENLAAIKVAPVSPTIHPTTFQSNPSATLPTEPEAWDGAPICKF